MAKEIGLADLRAKAEAARDEIRWMDDVDPDEVLALIESHDRLAAELALRDLAADEYHALLNESARELTDAQKELAVMDEIIAERPASLDDGDGDDEERARARVQAREEELAALRETVRLADDFVRAWEVQMPMPVMSMFARVKYQALDTNLAARERESSARREEKE